MRRPSDETLRTWGRSMREIDPGALQGDDEGPVRWFLGDGGTELFAWGERGDPPKHVQLVFARVSLEWSRERGLRTGSFSNQSATSGGRYDPYLLQLARDVDPDVCAAALLLVDEAAQVEATIRSTLADALRQALVTPNAPSAAGSEPP